MELAYLWAEHTATSPEKKRFPSGATFKFSPTPHYRGTSITRNVRHKKQSVFGVSRFLIIKKRTPSVLGTFLMNKKWTPSVSAEVLNKD